MPEAGAAAGARSPAAESRNGSQRLDAFGIQETRGGVLLRVVQDVVGLRNELPSLVLVHAVLDALPDRSERAEVGREEPMPGLAPLEPANARDELAAGEERSDDRGDEGQAADKVRRQQIAAVIEDLGGRMERQVAHVPPGVFRQRELDVARKSRS